MLLVSHPLYAHRRIRLEAWRNAQDRGNVAAGNRMGGETVYDAVPWFWSDQYDETLQVAGLSDEATVMVERKLDAGSLYFQHRGERPFNAASGIGPNGGIARDIRLVEMLIARRAAPDAAALASPGLKLKGLLR